MPRNPAAFHLLELAVKLATQNDFYAEAPLSVTVDDMIAATDALDLWLTPSPSTSEH